MSSLDTQLSRSLAVTTSLGADVLLLTGLCGREAISELFSFELDLIARNQVPIPFDRILGQPVGVRMELPDGDGWRYFSGICKSMSQGDSDITYTSYRLHMVPKFWLWTKRAQSRIFQHVSVPDILKKVLDGLVVRYEISGTFHPRDFCVQYRETDFNFACRLMEEEGIYYYFQHEDGVHRMIVANTPQSHVPLPTASTILYKNLTQGAAMEEDLIYRWEKSQEVKSGKFTLWDHTFELPHKHLQAEVPLTNHVSAGTVLHKFKIPPSLPLEIYDYPGEYAQRFDGVDRSGGERLPELEKIYQDNRRTTELRMQQEATAGIVIRGASNCRQLVSGHRFDLVTPPFDPTTQPARNEGRYVLTSVHHSAQLGGQYRSGGDEGWQYGNSFTCIPVALPFRPARVTPKPVVPGSQTAVVVGSHKGEEIFCDKYGRIKVQFHWDRQGKHDADSSCWIRVGTSWAGKQWGTMQIPRVGQEVIVDFLEGDPDQPIVVGSVFNAEQMPAYKLPDEKTKSYLKSNSSLGGAGYNEFRFEDKKGGEQIFVHAERNLDLRVKNDAMEHVVHDRHLIVGWEHEGKKGGNQNEKVLQDKNLHVLRHHQEHVEGNVKILIGKGQAADGGNLDVVIEKDRKEHISGDAYLHVDKNFLLSTSQKIVLQSTASITLKVGGNFIEINPSGVFIEGTMIKMNCGSTAATLTMTEAVDAKPADPAAADNSHTGHKSNQ